MHMLLGVIAKNKSRKPKLSLTTNTVQYNETHQDVDNSRDYFACNTLQQEPQSRYKGQW